MADISAGDAHDAADRDDRGIDNATDRPPNGCGQLNDLSVSQGRRVLHARPWGQEGRE
jgi:hypothetical protein